MPGITKPAVNDIIVFLNPENNQSLLAKIIVDIFYKGDAVYRAITGILFDESLPFYVLDKNYYFMLGDNYLNSRDSRFWDIFRNKLL